MKKRLAYFRNLAVLAVVGIFIGLSAAVSADTIVQSFQADTTIPPGWLVSLKTGSTNTVVLTPANQSNRVYGVTIDPSQAPVTLQRQAGQQVFVATSGIYPVLVSTQNGPINPGDYLSISSTNGIAAKATGDQTLVIGQASQKFDGTSGVLSSGSDFKIGKINATILPEHNPSLKNDVAIPSIVRSAGTSIAGKDISAARIYGGLAIFLAAAIMAIAILIAGIRSAMISIGRNPLSKRSIIRALSEVVVASLMVLALGLLGVYLLLKL